MISLLEGIFLLCRFGAGNMVKPLFVNEMLGKLNVILHAIPTEIGIRFSLLILFFPIQIIPEHFAIGLMLISQFSLTISLVQPFCKWSYSLSSNTRGVEASMKKN